MLVPWTPLSPSRREQGLRRWALALALASAVMLGIAACIADPIDPWRLVLAATVLALGVRAMRLRGSASIDVAVDGRGQVRARWPGVNGPVERGLQCVFAAPWLITLKCGTMWLPLWPDSVPGTTYRRLWVHIRWSSGRPPAEPHARSAPGRP